MANSVIKKTFSVPGGISIELFVVYLHIRNECLSYKFHPYTVEKENNEFSSQNIVILSQNNVPKYHPGQHENDLWNCLNDLN